MTFRRIAAIAGLVFIGLIVLSTILAGDQPTPSDSVDAVGEYLRQDTDVHKVGAIASYLIVLPAVVFFAGLLVPYRVSDRAHGEEWSTVMLLSVTVLAASAGTGDALWGSLVFRGAAGLNVSTTRSIFDAQSISYTLTGVGVAGIAGSVAVAGWTHKLAPAWYSALSALVAVLGVVAILGAVATGLWPLGLISFAAFALWSLVTSILMLRGQAPHSPAATP